MDGLDLLWRERLYAGTIGVHNLNLLVAAFHPDKRDLRSVRRPGRVLVIRCVGSQLPWVLAIKPDAKELLLSRDHCDIDEFGSIGRKRRVHIHGVC
jgi:hypothetical protein